MSKEYIDKSALYEKIAQLEELARNRYLETPSSSLCHSRYMTQLNERTALKHIIADFPSADVAPVRRGRCDVCSGKAVLTQDCYNGYSIEIDAEQQELSIWQGDKCLAYFHIDYCPSCGARMDKEEE